MSGYFIPNSTYKKMEQRGISEREIHDVWVNGEHIHFLTSKGLKRRFESQGYEVGISYGYMDSGQPIITGCWKRNIGSR